MHSGFEIPETEHQQPHALLLSMNQTHILEQIHHTQQRPFLDPPLLLPPHHHHQSRLSNQFDGGGAASASASFFPVNFKLGLNEIWASNDNKHGAVFGRMSEGEDALFHESKARHSSLGIQHCWQNQQDSAIKQPPFWESLAAEVSNENSDTIDRQEDREMNQKEHVKYCLERESRALYGELEAVYKNFTIDQTGPSIEEEARASASTENGKRKRKKKRKETIPVARFIEHLVKQMMHHQENLQKKFSEAIERFDEERREREEAWRSHELARYEEEADARAREKASAAGREAAIVSYLEKITGQRISLPPFYPTEITSTNASEDFRG